MSPATSLLMALRFLPSMMKSWLRRSVWPVMGLYNSSPAWISPDMTLKKVSLPRVRFDQVLKTKSALGPFGRRRVRRHFRSFSGNSSVAEGAVVDEAHGVGRCPCRAWRRGRRPGFTSWCSACRA